MKPNPLELSSKIREEQQRLERARASRARLLIMVFILVVVGAVGVAAWLWTQTQAQQQEVAQTATEQRAAAQQASDAAAATAGGGTASAQARNSTEAAAANATQTDAASRGQTRAAATAGRAAEQTVAARSTEIAIDQTRTQQIFEITLGSLNVQSTQLALAILQTQDAATATAAFSPTATRPYVCLGTIQSPSGGANIRESASANASERGSLLNGARVEIREFNRWYRIAQTNSRGEVLVSGWVNPELVAPDGDCPLTYPR